MVIDQRNAGASVTPSTGTYLVDRWIYNSNAGSKFSAQQNAGSVTPPTGFTNYLGLTVTSAYSVGSSDFFILSQPIEAYNTADIGFGTANCKTTTLSFWVRSSLTGTFGGVLENGTDATYPYTYTISSANTWTFITINVPAVSFGTWGTGNSAGIYVRFGLGAGSTYSGTAGSWSSNRYFNATGATSVVGTSGATFYITGVQLEVGSSATGFEYRQYGTELALCQRYYTYGENTTYISAAAGSIAYAVPFLVSMRAAPTVTRTGNFWTGAESGTTTSTITTYNFIFQNSGTVAAGGNWTATAEI
jgi:hypothetical protein